LPLHYACGTDNDTISTEMISFLIRAYPGALQMGNMWGSLPLHVACQSSSENADAVALMIHHWPQAVQVATKNDKSYPLHMACYALEVSLPVVRLLVQTWPDAIRSLDKKGFLPLHHACREWPGRWEQSLPLIQFLVESWPKSVQIATPENCLPLYLACLDNVASVDVIHYFIEMYPPAVKVQDYRRRLPLHLACTPTGAGGLPLLDSTECLVHAWPDWVHLTHDHGGKSNDNYIVIFRDGTKDVEHDHMDNVIPAVHSDDEESVKRGQVLEDGEKFGLPLDLVCSCSCHHPTPELTSLLTDGTPALHFALAHPLTYPAYYIRMKTLKYLKKRLSLDEWMRFHCGILPLHYACCAGAPRPALRWCWKQYPEAIRITTIVTEDTLLHCYLSFTGITALEKTAPAYTGCTKQHDHKYVWSAVRFLVKQYPAALYSRNQQGLLPLHVAAMHDAPLDILLYLAQQNPGSLHMA